MPQLMLPGFPDGSTRLNPTVSVLNKDGWVTYFVGLDTYYLHRSEDARAAHHAIALVIRNGHLKVSEAERSLNVPRRTLMNWLKKFDEEGCDAFFRSQTGRGAARVLTEDKVLAAERLLDEGESVAGAARELGIQESTLRKGLSSGRVKRLSRPEEGAEPPAALADAIDKSERSVQDAQAAEGMGTACTRNCERVAASVGLLDGASACFEPAKDVQLGGLLVGLPALCDNGLLSGLERHLSMPRGYYTALHIVQVLAYMALARLRRPEAVRHVPVGELGKVVGLDRIPEVSTLREKIKALSKGADEWIKELSNSWMQADPDEAGYLYVDGHVRVYHGTKANLPKRYVSRERLCLRGTTDYWVNDALGRPFFVVSQSVTHGLGSAILDDIVPELLETVPGQPSAEELESDPLKYRFVMVFDRECSNYKLISSLWERRIAAITYRKNVRDLWDEKDFTQTEVAMPNGETVVKRLAFRETDLKAGKEKMTVLEVRCLTETGHQTTIITTARTLSSPVVAGRMFTRWRQENFFAYMMQHYDIDGLVEYGVEELSGTTKVVNPAWRTLDKQIRDANRELRRKKFELADDFSVESEAGLDEKGVLLQKIETCEAKLESLREQRRETPKQVEIRTLPEEQRPNQLRPLSKQFTNAIKMIAYRAETALVQRLKKHLVQKDDAHALVREILVTAADIFPDEKEGVLHVKLHRMALPVHDRAVAVLLEELNQLEFRHPETNAKIIYQLVGSAPK